MEERNRIGLAINTASRLFKRRVENAISSRGAEKITGMQGFIIGYLSRNCDKDMFQKDIEKEFAIRRSTATSILQLMEKNGIITRVPYEKDGRHKKIVLTEKSLKRHEIFTEEIDRMENKLYVGLSDTEKEEFFRIIEKIISNIGE